MPLSVSDGLGAWVDDFKKSDAPQFKGKSAKERREMAIAAYLSAKRGDTNEALLPTKDVEKVLGKGAKPIKNVKNSDGTKQDPMSRARTLAKKARDAQKTNENNSAPQTAAHRRAMLPNKVKLKGFGPDGAKGNMGNPSARAALNPMKKRAQDNEKARQALKDPDHNPAWANSKTPKSKLEATDTQKQIVDLEKMLGRMSGNTSSVKMKKYALQRKIDKLKGQVKEARDPSKSGGSGYDLYHKDFSSAMKHAYGHAKKLGVDIDSKEIDDKVASGPRKPSKGKTNRYRLMGKDGKKAVQIQVHGMDSGKYELNMYKEEVEIHEAVLANRDYKVKDGRVHISKANFTKVHKDYKNATKGKERMTVLDPKSQATVSMPVRFAESVELDESVAKAYEIMKPTKSMNHGIEAIKKTMKVDHGTATRLARQVMDKVKKGEFKEGTADRYKLIKKIGDKVNKEKKKAERDAMRHAKRDNEFQTEGKAEELKGASAANAGQSYSSNPYPKGTPEHLSWSKGHNKARARRLNMGEAKEEFTKKHFHKNEDENRHTENGVKLVNKFGTSAENIKMGGIAARHNMRGSINRKDQQDRDALVKKYYHKLKDEDTSVKKTNEATQFKVDVEGLPPTFMNGKSVGEILARLRKIVKQPSMIQSVDRVTTHDVKKTYRDKAQGKED